MYFIGLSAMQSVWAPLHPKVLSVIHTHPKVASLTHILNFHHSHTKFVRRNHSLGLYRVALRFRTLC